MIYLSSPKLLSWCVLLFTCLGETRGRANGVKWVVKEDDDAVLPCSLSTKENIDKMLFDWKKDDEMEVFLYNGGIHYNNGRSGQDPQFRGRVFHFPEQLQHGNASIMIRNTKVADSGNYTCLFPHFRPIQTFNVELVVDSIIKDRLEEIRGASPEPYIRTLNATNDGVLLQCEVPGASPKPKVEWRDSAGNILPAEEPQVTFRGDRYCVILLTTVTKTDRFSCVVTQEEIHHRTAAHTYVPLCAACDSEGSASRETIVWVLGGLVGAVTVLAVLALLVVTKQITISCNKGSHQQQNGFKKSPSEVPLKPV